MHEVCHSLGYINKGLGLLTKKNQLHAQVRIPEEFGGDEELTRRFLVCNDTGSTVLTMFNSGPGLETPVRSTT